MCQHSGSLDKKSNLELWRVYFCSAQEKYTYVAPASPKRGFKSIYQSFHWLYNQLLIYKKLVISKKFTNTQSGK